jgi:acetyl esterase/lipase
LTKHRWVAVVLVLGGCAGAPATSIPPSSTPPTSPDVATSTTSTAASTPAPEVEHVSDATSDLFVPGGVEQAPLVVLIPGGGWHTADPAGLIDLARRLAESGIAAMTTTIRAGEDGVVYPLPVEDVICATSHGVVAAALAGVDAGPLILFGHSSGGHLAALAALAGDRYQAECPDGIVAADALIGVAGAYDVSADADVAEELFGVSISDDPDLWRHGNPLLQAGLHSERPVLLVHGDADRVVPLSFTTSFAEALRNGGHSVVVEVVAGVDHDTIYRPENIADLLVRWIRSL